MVEVVNRSLAANADESLADRMVAVTPDRLGQPLVVELNHDAAPGFAVAAHRATRAACIALPRDRHGSVRCREVTASHETTLPSAPRPAHRPRDPFSRFKFVPPDPATSVSDPCQITVISADEPRPICLGWIVSFLGSDQRDLPSQAGTELSRRRSRRAEQARVSDSCQITLTNAAPGAGARLAHSSDG